MDEYQQYIHKSRYARFLEDKNRRETWYETVERYCSFWEDKYPNGIFPKARIKDSILHMDVMPSMRCLMSAGPALERDHMAGYNCSYVAVDHVRCFDEIMYVLLCGTGVGFSVERQYITKLPEVSDEMHQSDTVIQVSDSKIGWASSFRELLALLYSGKIPKWDTQRVRSAGAKLKTFGGRASGPEPLEDLFRFTVNLFNKAKGRRLSSLEVHDLVCKIADVVVVGGVRRSALLSLSNLTDERMRNAKSGAWWEAEGQRKLANNSVTYTEKPDIGIFMKEWHSLYESKSGERGIFNRDAATRQRESTGRGEVHGYEYGTNPCGEIILRPSGLCNLSEVVVRAEDTLETLKEKVRTATIIGTFQSTLTEFRYVRPIWKRNAEEERLLGVSLTGIMDHKVMSNSLYDVGITEENCLEYWLQELKNVAIQTNADWAKKLGITPSNAITTVKPSGTVSQLVDSSSGIHPRHSPYYLRTVRTDKQDPLAKWMRSKGFPVEDDFTSPNHTDIFTFPIKAPEGCLTGDNINAIQQLEHYLIYKRNWCEHNPSITVYVREHEWIEVSAWVYNHFDDLGGVSFLPHDSGTYRQAPYQRCTEEEYLAFVKKLPKLVDWNTIVEFEDNTTGTQELNCQSGVCEIG